MQALKKWGVQKIGSPIYALPGVRIFEWMLDQDRGREVWILSLMNVGLSSRTDEIIKDFIKDCLC